MLPLFVVPLLRGKSHVGIGSMLESCLDDKSPRNRAHHEVFAEFIQRGFGGELRCLPSFSIYLLIPARRSRGRKGFRETNVPILKRCALCAVLLLFILNVFSIPVPECCGLGLGFVKQEKGETWVPHLVLVSQTHPHGRICKRRQKKTEGNLSSSLRTGARILAKFKYPNQYIFRLR